MPKDIFGNNTIAEGNNSILPPKESPKDIANVANGADEEEMIRSKYADDESDNKTYNCRNVAFDTITYRRKDVGWIVTGMKENPDEGDVPEFILKDPRMIMRRIDRGFFLIQIDTHDNHYVIRDCDPLPTA